MIDFFKNGVVKNIMNCFPDLEKTLNYARITKNEKKFGLEDQNKILLLMNNFFFKLDNNKF